MWETHLFTDRTEVKSFSHQFDFYDQWEFKNKANGSTDDYKTKIMG